MEDTVQRFLFEELDIRGAIVRLNHTWQLICAQRDYEPKVASLLGQMCAVTSIIGANLKQPARITFQMSGNRHIPLLVVDCSEQLNLRGYAQVAEEQDEEPEASALLDEQGQLLMTLDMASARVPYQSYVPITGETIAEIFEHYLEQSEQQPSVLVLSADEQGVAGLFLQKLPHADTKDADGWNRVSQLARTLKSEEQLRWSALEVLQKLFSEETVRVFEPRAVTHDFAPDWEKIRNMLRSLGREEIEQILAEQGQISIRDDLSNHEYRFTAEEARALFNEMH